METKTFVTIVAMLVLSAIAIVCVSMLPMPTNTTPAVNADIVYPVTFDPRDNTVGVSYADDTGVAIRGLKMTDETFEFMTNDVDPYTRMDMRGQVDAHERNYTREYVVSGGETDYVIENGMIRASYPHNL